MYNSTDNLTVPLDDFKPQHSQLPAYTAKRKLKIVTVGAGFSGLIFAHKLQHERPEFQKLVSHKIFELRHDIGGTWLANKYPGVQCDVPAHVYAFPFDPKPDWDRFYARGEDIHAYIKDTVKKWNLDRDVYLNHKVTKAIWQADIGRWQITVESSEGRFTEYADFFVSAQGVLNNWRWPDISGLKEFRGHICHSAEWDTSYDFSNKTIAVVGNGSSGVQIVPKLAAVPGTKVISIQRSPNYVYSRAPPARLLGRDDPTQNPAYTEEDKLRFRTDRDFHREYRRKIIHSINSSFKMFVKGSPENLEETERARKQMADKLNHIPKLCDNMIPQWALGCRRITPAEGYLECFSRPNVQVVFDTVTSMTTDSVVTASGKSFKVDAVACATGFEVSWRPQWQMIGIDRTDLNKEWALDSRSYLSVAAKDMPNYFIFLGPNAVVTHGSLIESINWTADYILKWLYKVATEDIRSITPKTAAMNEFIEKGDNIHETLVWTDSCSSWFKRNSVNGRVTAGFGGSALLFRKLLQELRPEDFDIEYRTKNRWDFLGNGFTDYESDVKNDLSWYIKN